MKKIIFLLVLCIFAAGCVGSSGSVNLNENFVDENSDGFPDMILPAAEQLGDGFRLLNEQDPVLEKNWNHHFVYIYRISFAYPVERGNVYDDIYEIHVKRFNNTEEATENYNIEKSSETKNGIDVRCVSKLEKAFGDEGYYSVSKSGDSERITSIQFRKENLNIRVSATPKNAGPEDYAKINELTILVADIASQKIE